MPVSLVLCTPPASLKERYGAFAAAANTEPSFGLACLAAVAREAGARVTIVEASAVGLSVEAAVQRVLTCRPDVLGLTATTSGIQAPAELAGRVKTACPDCLVLIGGCHATALPLETLRDFPAFDRVVMQEGETTLKDIVVLLEQDATLPPGLPGTAERHNGTERLNTPREPVADLDTLPLPAWDLIDGFPQSFRPSPARIRRWPCASIVLTRGCPNQCTFCDRSVFGRHCRAYSPAYAVRMIGDLVERFGVREVLIEDDTFIISRQRVAEFCERLIASRLDVTWSCLGRADRVTPDLLRAMRAAGCWHISYGIESGDPDILKRVHKHLDLPRIREALIWSRQAGLRTKGFFMVGFPGETAASIEATRRVALELPLDDISVMLLSPFPGSEIFHTAREYGTFDQDWRRMTTIEPVFVPHGFTKQALENARARLLRDFYLRPTLLMRQARYLALHPRALLATLRGFGAFLKVIRQHSTRAT